MNIIKNLRVNSFTFEELNKRNINHRFLISRLSTDELVKEYLWNLKNCFIKDESSNYVIKHNNDYIGFIRFTEIYYDRYIGVDLAIKKEHRGKGYSKVILSNVSDYLLNNNIVNAIELDIVNDNIPSIKSAISSGFVLEKKFTDNSKYIKKRG